MTALNKQALLSTDKHTNQHMLSRLIVEANSAEIRDIAEAVEQYTDRLIAALEDAEKRIAELEARTVTLPKDAEHDVMAPVVAYFLDAFNWDGSAVRWDGRKEYDIVADRVKYALNMVFCRAAGIGVKGE